MVQFTRNTLRLCYIAMLLVTALLAGACKRSPEPPQVNRYNVVLVTLDTTRADYLGCYNPDRRDNTPNFDAVASDGVLFESAIAQSSATPISHASILTGLYPFQHGLRVIYALSGCTLHKDIAYLPQVLQKAGWTTAAFLSSFTVSEFYGFDRGFDTYDSGLTRDPESLFKLDTDGKYMWGPANNQRRSDATTDAALKWLDGLGPSREPFMLWVHYWDPHDAYPAVAETMPPYEFSRPYIDKAENKRRGLYEAEVAFVDQQFGRLIDGLRASGHYDDTVLVVVADHGQGLGDHSWWAHRLLYQEQINVPLLVRAPGWPAGQRVKPLVRNIDIYPTILSILNVESPHRVEGKSFEGLVQGAAGPPRMAYADVLNKFDLNSRVARRRPFDTHIYCVMDDTWKLIWRYEFPDRSELFNIKEDPDELVNLLDKEVEQKKRLHDILTSMEPFRTEPFPDTGTGTDQEAMERLQSLGYLGGEEDADD